MARSAQHDVIGTTKSGRPIGRIHIYRSQGNVRTTVDEFSSWLMGHQTFRTSSGNFRGGPVVGSVAPNQHGTLTGKPRGVFDDMANIIDYVVYSYDTPIGWHDRITGTWVFVSMFLSNTTTKHQAALLFSLCDTNTRKVYVNEK